jgi:class 3 adenylate cyclase
MGYIILARTARVMSVAYGEQIIISKDVYELAKEKLL